MTPIPKDLIGPGCSTESRTRSLQFTHGSLSTQISKTLSDSWAAERSWAIHFWRYRAHCETRYGGPTGEKLSLEGL